MQIKTLALLLASALTITAHPALQQLNTRGSDSYTCGNAYDDCQGKGKGKWVCWADDDDKSHGKWSGDDMKRNKDKPLKDYCKKTAYCCQDDPFLDLEISILGIIEIDLEVTLEEKCGGQKIW